MRLRCLGVGIVLLAVVGFLVLALPPLERKLMEQPSCFAFIGMKREPHERWVSDDELRVSLNGELADAGLERPKPPYVIIVLSGGEVGWQNVIVAARSADEWKVSEAGRPWIRSEQKLLGFQPLPSRTLSRADGRRLDELLSKRCLYGEPTRVSSDPDVLFSLVGPGMTYDFVHRTIEVNNGEKSHLVVQGQASGINGAVSELLLRDARGFVTVE